MTTKTVRITKSLDEEIKHISATTKLSQLDVIRLAIQRGLSDVEEFAGEKSKEQNNEREAGKQIEQHTGNCSSR